MRNAALHTAPPNDTGYSTLVRTISILKDRRSGSLSDARRSFKRIRFPDTPLHRKTPLRGMKRSSTPLPYRRRSSASAFDIDNIVIPATMMQGPNFRIQVPEYREVITPKWRFCDITNPAAAPERGMPEEEEVRSIPKACLFEFSRVEGRGYVR